MAIAVRVIGFVGLLAAFTLILVPLIEPIRLWMPFTVIPALWFTGGAVLLAMAFVCLFCGATIALFSDLALAVRDIACNSFRPEAPVNPADGPMAPSPPSMLLPRRVDPIEPNTRPDSLLSMMASDP